MITGELKSKVDGIWNTMWSGGISNPLSVIEQLTYLLFIKGLDELHTAQGAQGRPHRQADRGAGVHGPPGRSPLVAFKQLAQEQMFETVRDRVFPSSSRWAGRGTPTRHPPTPITCRTPSS